MLSVSRTVAAVLVASFGAVVAHLAVSAVIGDMASTRGSFVVALLVGAIACIVGLVLVLPVLLLVPRLRLLPWWAAAAWGAAVAFLATMLIVGPTMARRTGSAMAVLGAASGLTYVLAARVLLYKQRAV